MQVDDLPLSLDQNVDFTKIAPIHQKHTLAFINQFTMRTVSFLNKFAQSCESRLMDFEYKLQKVEAALLILESQLSSISGLDDSLLQNKSDACNEIINVELPDVTSEVNANQEIIENEVIEQNTGVAACEDSRYKKFFKMVQFGVPEAAVKLKMQNEGLDPNILNKPSEILPGSTNETIDNNDTDSSSA